MNETETRQELPAHESIPKAISRALETMSKISEARGLDMLTETPTGSVGLYTLLDLLNETKFPDKHKDELCERLRDLMEKAPSDMHDFFVQIIELKGKKSDSQDAADN